MNFSPNTWSNNNRVEGGRFQGHNSFKSCFPKQKNFQKHLKPLPETTSSYATEPKNVFFKNLLKASTYDKNRLSSIKIGTNILPVFIYFFFDPYLEPYLSHFFFKIDKAHIQKKMYKKT